MNAKRPNRPRSSKTHSQGSDSDKLTDACRRRGLMLPISNPKSDDQRLAQTYLKRQPTKHAAYINKLLIEQDQNDDS